MERSKMSRDKVDDENDKLLILVLGRLDHLVLWCSRVMGHRFFRVKKCDSNVSGIKPSCTADFGCYREQHCNEWVLHMIMLWQGGTCLCFYASFFVVFSKFWRKRSTTSEGAVFLYYTLVHSWQKYFNAI